MAGRWRAVVTVCLVACGCGGRCRAEEPRKLNPAEFAPIKHPFIVSWFYGGESPAKSATYRSKYLNINTFARENVNDWSDMGVLPLVWESFHGLEGAAIRAGKGYAGVCLDELTRPDESPHNREIFQACAELKKQYPDFYIGVHGNTCPPSLVDAIDKGYVDHFYLENYTYFWGRPPMVVSLEGIRQRVRICRAAGILDRTVWHIGNLQPEPDQYFPKGFSPDRMEREMQFLRQWGPEVGGICFYFCSMNERKDHPLYAQADDLTYEYFIRPAPEVTVRLRQMPDGTARVGVKAGRSSFGGRTVRHRIFLDDELVSESDAWIWETRNSTPGKHLVTAHAITEDWYRGGAQVSVWLENGRIRKSKALPDERPKGKRVKRLEPAGGGEPTGALALDGDTLYLGVSRSIHVIDLQTGVFPGKIAEVTLDRNPERLAVAGDSLYVAAGESGVIIVDVGEPGNPRIKGRYEAVDRAEDVFATDDLLLVAAGSDGLVLLDTSDGAKPGKIGSYPLEYAWGVVARDGVAYVAAGFEGLAVIDIGDPSEPKLIGVQDTVDCALRVAVSGGTACVADWHSGVRIIDVSEPATLKEIGHHHLPWAWDVAMKDSTVYAADENIGLHEIDISDPANPKASIVRDIAEPGDALNVVVRGDTAFFVDGWIGMLALDVSEGASRGKRRFLYPIDSVWNVWQKGVADYD